MDCGWAAVGTGPRAHVIGTTVPYLIWKITTVTSLHGTIGAVIPALRTLS